MRRGRTSAGPKVAQPSILQTFPLHHSFHPHVLGWVRVRTHTDGQSKVESCLWMVLRSLAWAFSGCSDYYYVHSMYIVRCIIMVRTVLYIVKEARIVSALLQHCWYMRSTIVAYLNNIITIPYQQLLRNYILWYTSHVFLHGDVMCTTFRANLSLSCFVLAVLLIPAPGKNHSSTSNSVKQS